MSCFDVRMSLGGIYTARPTDLNQQVLTRIVEQGVVVVVAAGNEGAAGVSRCLSPHDTLASKAHAVTTFSSTALLSRGSFDRRRCHQCRQCSQVCFLVYSLER